MNDTGTRTLPGGSPSKLALILVLHALSMNVWAVTTTVMSSIIQNESGFRRMVGARSMGNAKMILTSGSKVMRCNEVSGRSGPVVYF